MPAVLDYQHVTPPCRDSAILSPRLILSIVLAFTHINLCWQISSAMLVSLCDGLASPQTQWCPAVWVPGAAAMNQSGLAAGIPLLVAGSALAGWMLCDLILRKAHRLPHPCGPLAWRLWTALLLWAAWLPVPGTCSFIWQFRQWAIYG